MPREKEMRIKTHKGRNRTILPPKVGDFEKTLENTFFKDQNVWT